MLILALVADCGFLTHRAIASVPIKEFKRMPPDHAKGLLALVRLGAPAIIFIWLLSTAAAAVLFFQAVNVSYWLGALIAGLIGLEVIRGYLFLKPGSWFWRQANWFSQAVAWLLHFAEPLLKRLPNKQPESIYLHLFETEDLLDLLKRQQHQADNRISQEDLTTARATLSFSAKTVAQTMVPIKNVRLVLPDEAIGPHLMDELHAAGYSSFPIGKKVGKKLPPEISGTVYLTDLVANSLKATAGQVASDEVVYIEESKKLSEALETFLKAKSLLLIVRNEREEPVGALWLEDVLEQLLGRSMKQEVDVPADADARQK